jgi:2-polyprenyl-3-methyl-5-hydroxy-6-metoxy-1,4-benzoquinol methylase
MSDGAGRQAGDGERIVAASAWYLTEQLDFDRELIRFRYRTLRPYISGPRGLELGSAEGQMTRLIADDFDELTVVDGSRRLLDAMPTLPNVTKIVSLIEEFAPSDVYDTVIIDHVLEHVADPQAILGRARGWIAPGGRMIVGVPNAHSIHRLVGVKMGLLADPTDLNDRDRAVGHRRVYTPESFERVLRAARLRPVHLGGVFLKPLSNRQIQDGWDDALKEAFYQLGSEFPGHAAELFAVCEADPT